MTESSSAQRLFAVPDFRRLWASNLLGDVGAAFASLALSVTAVVVLHASAIEVAIIAAMANGAYLFLGVPVGVWADRIPAKRLLVAADLARFVAVATVPLAAVLHVLTVWQLIVVAAITSAANVTFDIAHTTVLPTLVGRDRVSTASARLQTVDSSVSVVGPGLAGQLIALTTGPVAYLVTAGVHLVSSVFAATLGGSRAAPAGGHPRFWPSLRTGLGYVLGTPLQRTFMIAAATVNFGAGAIGGIQPLFVLRTLHFSAAEYGLVLSIGGIGGIAGSLVGLWIRRHVGEIRTPIICYALIPLAFAPTPLAPYLPIPPAVSVATGEFLVAFVIVTAMISSSGVYARMTPPDLLGRVTSARRTVSIGVVPVGTILAGAFASLLSYDTLLWIGAGIIASSVFVFVFSPIFRVRDLPKEWEWSEPVGES